MFWNCSPFEIKSKSKLNELQAHFVHRNAPIHVFNEWVIVRLFTLIRVRIHLLAVNGRGNCANGYSIRRRWKIKSHCYGFGMRAVQYFLWDCQTRLCIIWFTSNFKLAVFVLFLRITLSICSDGSFQFRAPLLFHVPLKLHLWPCIRRRFAVINSDSIWISSHYRLKRDLPQEN